ncbi:unnamed protein product, partial [Oppiella nova]
KCKDCESTTVRVYPAILDISQKGKGIGIDYYDIHPEYQKGNTVDKAFDVALIKLETEFHFSRPTANGPPYRTANSICLPVRDIRNEREEYARVTGLGGRDTNRLQVGWQVIHRYKELWVSHYGLMILTIRLKNHHTLGCLGDSGSSLIQYVNGRAVMIGVLAHSSNNCAQNGVAFYVRVSFIIDWITNSLKTITETDPDMNYPAINECHIGFVGAGTMAYAMASGFVSSGAVKASQLSVSAPSNRNLKRFEALGCHVTNNNNDLFSHLSAPMRHKTLKIIFLCVKPLVFKQPVLDMNAYAKEPAVLVVSVMAGVNLETIVRRLEVDPADCTRNPDKGQIFVARIMPNTACAVNAGVCGVSYVTTGARDYSQRLKAFLSVLLTPLGVCEFVDEKQMDAVCGLSGSGIAFVRIVISFSCAVNLMIPFPSPSLTHPS